MHHTVDELLRNAGFSKKIGTRKLSDITGTSGAHDQQGSAIESVKGQIEELQSISHAQINSPLEPIPQSANIGSQTSFTGGVSSSLKDAASGLLGGGNLLEGLLGGGLLGDLFSGISNLFGGGQSQPTPLVRYTAPQSQDFELATGGGQVGDAVYNQFGSPQVSAAGEPALAGLQYLGAPSGRTSESGSTGGASTSQGAPQITFNVQAMDSQSFLDRSQDIAHAVRHAMLNMHSINDVINDL